MLNEPLDPGVVNFNASKISEYDPYAINRKYDRTLRPKNHQSFSLRTHTDEMENQAHTDTSYQGLIVDNRNSLFVSKAKDAPNASHTGLPAKATPIPPPSPGSYAARTGFGALKFSIVNCSSQACNKEVKHLKVFDKKKFWQATGVSKEHVIFKFSKGSCLLSTVDVYNKDCDGMNIFVGEEKARKKLRLAKSVKFLSKGRVNSIRVGHVPCRYVKLEFVKNKLRPGPTIYGIRFVGMLSETVEQELPSLSNLLVRNTEDLLYHD